MSDRPTLPVVDPATENQSTLSRRDALGVLGMIPAIALFEWKPAAAERAALAAHRALTEVAQGKAYVPKNFTAHEWRTVRLLVDYIIPRDARSGSATDAGVPEFMDFMIGERTDMQLPLKGGLAWLDTESRERHTVTFAAATDAQRRAILDDIAWPKKARPDMSHGVAFFNSFRDFTAGGFFSSKMGVADVKYIGNTALAEWKGCPQAATDKLGVSYS
jgi:gluconate 2-dehydrogenase gamma chain